jgi:glycosyltransferase involved in cell wall biosynthesis
MQLPKNKIKRLLICTQRMDANDSVLGFFHRWVEEFATNYSQVVVVCLEQGSYNLPENVRVFSLGKETGKSRFKYLWRFYKYLWQERHNYDNVFVHMNVEYVILGGLWWRLARRKIGLWYAHKNVDWRLRLAEIFTDCIFTASLESFGLKSHKLKVIGHGIDTDHFSPNNNKLHSDGIFKILCVGRISRIKNQHLLISALSWLVNKMGIKNVRILLVGSVQTVDDRAYYSELKKSIDAEQLNDYFEFVGSIKHQNLVDYYRRADMSINLCPTGGLDKVVLEALSCGVPAVVYNKTFIELLGPYKDLLVIKNNEPKEIANKIKELIDYQPAVREEMVNDLRQVVEANYGIKRLVEKIFQTYDN